MIRERPFVPKWAIVGSYRPGTDEEREGVFKGLRRKGLVSAGVPRSLHQRATGRLAGQMRLYCVLNQDAARLARHGFDEDAARLVGDAGDIELSRDAATVVDAVLAHVETVTTDYDQVISEALREAATDVTVRDALLRVSERIEEARARSAPLAKIERTALGRVTRTAGTLVEVLLQDGHVIALDAETLAPHDLARLGAPLALHWERWGNGQGFFEAEPGIEVGDDPVEALQARFAFLRPPSDDDEVWAAAATIAGAVEIGTHVSIARS